MKIVYITRADFGVLGGAASYFIPAYTNTKCDVTVLSNVVPGSTEKIVFSDSSLMIHDIYARDPTERVMKALDHIRRVKPDIIHVFHGPECLRYPHMLRERLPGAKWVLDFRSPPVTQNVTALKKTLSRYFFCQFYYDLILTHSKLTIKDNLPLRFRTFKELPLGVELAQIPFTPNIKQKPENFVYIGSVTKSRQLEMLVLSFAEFVIQNRRSATLDIIGDGDALEELKELVVSKKIGDYVKIKGFMPQQEVYRMLCDYDAGIAYVPYEMYTRAPSLKSLEYAAAGLPILASDTKGHKDYVKRFGFQFSLFRNSSQGIHDALRVFFKESSIQNVVAENRKVVENFDWEKMVKNTLLPLYKKLANKVTE